METVQSLTCTECEGPLNVTPSLVGEILDCDDCGAELEVTALHPPTVALAPEIEEDWGE